MKTKKTIIILLGILLSINPIFSQSIKRSAKKEAKKLTRSGYYVTPGALPIRQQLTRAYTIEQEYDSIGFPKYFLASGLAVAQTHSAAQAHATAVAKIMLANMIESNIAGIIETDLSNNQLTTKEAKSISKVVSAYTELIAQEIGRIIPVVTIYRKNGKNIEADVRIAYNISMAMKAAKDVLMDKLEKETNVAREKLEKLMDLNRLNKGK